MMMCPSAVMDQEKRFFDALGQARTFRFDSEGKLTFVDKDGRPVLRFARSG
jgi:putative lipoprotein